MRISFRGSERLPVVVMVVMMMMLSLLAWLHPARAGQQPQLPKEIVEALGAGVPITLYSLQPRGGPDLPEWDFRGHHILGHLDLDPEQRKLAVVARPKPNNKKQNKERNE